VANIYLNNLQNKIVHHNLALGSADGQILEFELSDNNSGDHRIRTSNDDGVHNEAARKVISVKSERFDSIVREIDRTSSLIWMDTQGYEGFIMDGARAATSMRVPFVIEFWPYGIGRTHSYELLRKSILAYEHFYDLAEEQPRPRPTSEIDALHKKIYDAQGSTDILLI
jgi:FkbM family methyltransferase